jgi:hypothetical protein
VSTAVFEIVRVVDPSSDQNICGNPGFLGFPRRLVGGCGNFSRSKFFNANFRSLPSGAGKCVGLHNPDQKVPTPKYLTLTKFNHLQQIQVYTVLRRTNFSSFQQRPHRKMGALRPEGQRKKNLRLRLKLY